MKLTSNTFRGEIKDGVMSYNEPYARSVMKKYEDCDVRITIERVYAKRSPRQNRALHLYLAQVAEALDREGHTVQDIVKQIKKAEIHPTQSILKEIVWRPLQEIILGKESTTELGKLDVDKVYEVFNKWLGQSFEIHIPFPSYDSEEEYNDATLRQD